MTISGMPLCGWFVLSECYAIFAISCLFVIEHGCEPVEFSKDIGLNTRAIEFKNPVNSRDGDAFPTLCLGYAIKLCSKLDKLIVPYSVFREILGGREVTLHENIDSLKWGEFFSYFLSNQQCRFVVRDIYQPGAGLRDLTLPAELDLSDSVTNEHAKDAGQGDFVLNRSQRSEVNLNSDDMLMLMRHVWRTCVRLVYEVEDGFGKCVQVKGLDVFITHRYTQNLWMEPRRQLTVSF
jgi:hypothetical protein